MLLSSDPSPWLAVFGRFHVVLLHLPIGLLPGMFVLEFGAALLRKPAPRGALLALAVLTALTAGAALASGLVLADEKVDSDLLGTHKKFAIAMTALCALLPLLAFRRSRRPFRLALAAALAVSVPTGHFGGSVTHKRDFLFKPLQRAADAPPADEQAESSSSTTEIEVDTTDDPPPAALSRFDREIRPIFESLCVECHKADDPDGDLVLTTKEGILCLDRAEDERVIVPGKPEQSIMIELLELPLDDDDHMPPSDEKQPTPEQIAALRRWIADGAPFE